MDNQNKYAEENIQRMLQAGMAGHAQLDNSLYAEMLIRLKDELCIQSISEFPAIALGLITAILWLIGLGWFGRSGSVPPWETNLIAILIGINLFFVPIGSIVIVNRRRYVQTS